MKTVISNIIPANKLPKFLKEHEGQKYDLEYNPLSNSYSVRILVEETYYEFQMRILAELRENFEPSDDAYNALNEGISALKTIADMVSKGE